MLTYPYNTLGEDGHAELTVKQSVFISNAKRIFSKDEAEDYVRSIRKEYPDSRHTCYAWIYEGESSYKKQSDDGEPQGTAGLQILGILEKQGLINTALTVTRYFGGILLGKGGLTRAYSDSASMAIANARKVEINLGEEYLIKASYEMAPRLISSLKLNGFEDINTTYLEEVDIKLTILKKDEQKLIKTVSERSSGAIIPVSIGIKEIESYL